MKNTKFLRTMRLLILSLFVSTFFLMFDNIALNKADNSLITSSKLNAQKTQKKPKKPKKIDPNFKCSEQKTVNNEVNNQDPSFLFIGDSIMEYIGGSIESKLKSSYNIKKSTIDFKISSGLNRIDFYDWYKRTPQLIECYQPDIIVIMFGGNDDQDIKDDQGKSIAVLTPEWKEVYRKRAERYAELVSVPGVKKVYWIGQPMSSKSHYNQHFSIFNEIYQEVSKNYSQITFVDVWDIFATNGKFNPIVSDRSGKKAKVRTNDGLHITSHGSNILADLIIDKMLEDQIIELKP
jgi:uncharacterized protein